MTTTYTANQLNQYTLIQNGITNSPLYDDDGNMIFDGVYTNEWNGENRLVSTEPISPAIGAKKAEFAYDFMGRRWQKIVSAYDGTN